MILGKSPKGHWCFYSIQYQNIFRVLIYSRWLLAHYISTLNNQNQLIKDIEFFGKINMLILCHISASWCQSQRIAISLSFLKHALRSLSSRLIPRFTYFHILHLHSIFYYPKTNSILILVAQVEFLTKCPVARHVSLSGSFWSLMLIGRQCGLKLGSEILFISLSHSICVILLMSMQCLHLSMAAIFCLALRCEYPLGLGCLVTPRVCSAAKFRNKRISALRDDFINIPLKYKRSGICFLWIQLCCVGSGKHFL